MKSLSRSQPQRPVSRGITDVTDPRHTVDVVAGDLFQARAQSLGNAINCVGVMGKGIALEFKKRFPIVYEDYVERCKRDEVKLGRPYLYRNPQPPHVLNRLGAWMKISNSRILPSWPSPRST